VRVWYFPYTHALQVVAPFSLWCCPATHASQIVWPLDVWDFPASQVSQDVWPVAEKYKKKEKRSENNDGKQMKMSVMRISNLKWF